MNKLMLFISLGLLATGCSKSSDPNKKPLSLSDISGTYVDYKSIDTAYMGGNVANGIVSITMQSTYGDTTTFYPNSPNVKTYYNNISFDPKSVTQDTLRFSSAGNTAVETNANTDIPPIKFTYNLKAGTYNDGHANIRERIVRINSTTIEMLSSFTDGSLTGEDVTAIYYRKQ